MLLFFGTLFEQCNLFQQIVLADDSGYLIFQKWAPSSNFGMEGMVVIFHGQHNTTTVVLKTISGIFQAT